MKGEVYSITQGFKPTPHYVVDDMAAGASK